MDSLNTNSAGSRGNMPQYLLFNQTYMKFTIHRADLLTALNITGKAVGKSSQPILENFLFEVSAKSLKVTSSSMDIFISKIVDAESDTEKSLCVPADKLLKLIKTLSEQELTFEVKDLILTIKAKSGKYTLPVLDSEDFPSFPLVESEPIGAPGSEIAKGIENTLFAINPNDNRSLAYSCLRLRSGIKFIGTDAHILGTQNIELDIASDIDLLIQKKSLEILAGLDLSGVVSLSFNATNAKFDLVDGTSLCTILNHGNYPDIDGLIPVNNKFLQADVNELKNAIRRVILFSNEKNLDIKIAASKDALTISAANVAYKEDASEEVDFKAYDGEEITIGVKGDLLLSVLSRLESPIAYISFKEHNTPMLIKNKENDSINNLFLIMPFVV